MHTEEVFTLLSSVSDDWLPLAVDIPFSSSKCDYSDVLHPVQQILRVESSNELLHVTFFL
jgi:hypothetical protein